MKNKYPANTDGNMRLNNHNLANWNHRGYHSSSFQSSQQLWTEITCHLWGCNQRLVYHHYHELARVGDRQIFKTLLTKCVFPNIGVIIFSWDCCLYSQNQHEHLESKLDKHCAELWKICLTIKMRFSWQTYSLAKWKNSTACFSQNTV